MDRRRHIRYSLKGTVNFCWKDEGGLRQGEGFTREVSEAGMFVLTDTCPPVGATARLDVLFHSLLAYSQVHMQAKAQVLRVEPSSDAATVGGFAATIKALVLHSRKTGA